MSPLRITPQIRGLFAEHNRLVRNARSAAYDGPSCTKCGRFLKRMDERCGSCRSRTRGQRRAAK